LTAAKCRRFGRGGNVAVIASAKETVNVLEVLQGTGAFGADEVRKLEEALVYGQCAELRQATQALQAQIEEGEKGKGKLLRAGVALYLLGDHAAAEPILAKVSGDGLADFYHGQVLLGLGRNQDAAKAFVNKLRPEDRVLIVSLTDDFKKIVEPTSDRQALTQAIAGIKPGAATPL
jgi:hypothetical protein